MMLELRLTHSETSISAVQVVITCTMTDRGARCRASTCASNLLASYDAPKQGNKL